jgi:hypothetical protein
LRRSKKLALTVFSILLWAQLVFSIGLGLWRYLLISSGEAELFVSTSPRRLDPLLEETESYCPDDTPVAFLGDESSFYYVQYRLFPKRVARYRFDIEDPKPDEVTIRVDEVLQKMHTGACLLVDRLPANESSLAVRTEVNGEFSIYIVE